MKVAFEIFYSDLNETSQFYLCKAFKTTPEDENWEIQPLAVIEREMKGEEE